MQGGRTPQCTLKNDLSLERPSSVEDKARGTPRDALLVVLDADRADAVIEHRKRLRKPLTTYAARLLAGKFRQSADPTAAADAMIANGWLGFDPSWLSGRQARAPAPRRERDGLFALAGQFLSQQAIQHGGGDVIDHE